MVKYKSRLVYIFSVAVAILLGFYLVPPICKNSDACSCFTPSISAHLELLSVTMGGVLVTDTTPFEAFQVELLVFKSNGSYLSDYGKCDGNEPEPSSTYCDSYNIYFMEPQ